MTEAACVFCDHLIVPTDYVCTWSYWQVIINHNQDYLGKVMLVLLRHETDVTALKEAEQVEFWQLLAAVRKALSTLFRPDHFNYAFLMNGDRHVHFHVIPRYSTSREFAGLIFSDGQLGEHYQLRDDIVDEKVRQNLADVLRAQMPDPPQALYDSISPQ
jgi:diadenosine tetraphosphate (Ap4A) HIT family hydrolase